MSANIMNTNNNKANNGVKAKQKSILDYFNRSVNCDNNKNNSTNNQLKRNNNLFDKDLNKNKKFKNTDEICIIDETIVDQTTESDENEKKSLPLVEKEIKSGNNIEVICLESDFIDTNEFLEIDFHINEETKEPSVGDDVKSGEDQIHNNDNHMNGSYVYNNFRLMIDQVLKDEQYVPLFDANDWKVIESFTSLSGLAQMLFMRLFLRKRDWIRKNGIKYPEIANDFHSILNELVDNGFLLNATHLDDLHESLNILDPTEIRRVCRSLNGLNMNGLTTKKAISSAIVKYVNTCQPVIKSDNLSNQINEAVLKSIKTILRDVCFKVNEIICDVFERMFLLQYKPEINEEDSHLQLSFEFFKILKVDTGEEVYPKYTINKSCIIYKNRNDLVSYAIASKLETEILSGIENKSFDQLVNNLMNRAKLIYLNAIKDIEDVTDLVLPSFLRQFTAGEVYIRSLSHCVNVLEQTKCYAEAVDLLKNILLAQNIYCQDYRGRWYERLALNLEKHLKDPKSALAVIEKALKDGFVRTGHRYALYMRRKNLEKCLKMSFANIPEYDLVKYNETVIFAETVKYKINDRKNIFKITDSNGDVTVMPVEDIVIQHYKNNGFTDGIHTEGLVYHTIFGLLFWDIIYMTDCSDSFRFNHQRLPLDFNADQFYERRKTQILSLIKTLNSFDTNQINNVLENCWNSNNGIVSLVNWNNLEINRIKEIATCLGPTVITSICERLVKDFRHTRSGFPDLLLWNNTNHTVKAVEVKGPGDKPSAKQKLWLSYMESIGIDAEICHVKVKKNLNVN